MVAVVKPDNAAVIPPALASIPLPITFKPSPKTVNTDRFTFRFTVEKLFSCVGLFSLEDSEDKIFLNDLLLKSLEWAIFSLNKSEKREYILNGIKSLNRLG